MTPLEHFGNLHPALMYLLMVGLVWTMAAITTLVAAWVVRDVIKEWKR